MLDVILSPFRVLKRKLGCTPSESERALRFHADLIRWTNNFGHTTWLGNPIWQNVFDLWVIQEAISEIRPSLLLETGTNRGGSSLFYAHLFDLMGRGNVITVDVEKLHDLRHPRIEYLVGDSAGVEVMSRMRECARATDGPVMVILDSDHSEKHVKRELEAYAPLVSKGSLMLVQDGIIDVLDDLAGDRPGPLPAIESFLTNHAEFELDKKRCRLFPLTHHPKGWLRRI